MSKQLLMGIAIGVACTGLVVLLFSGGVPAPVVSDAGNLKLLAQVAPSEELMSSSDSREPLTQPGGEIIEVRVPPAEPLKTDAQPVVPEEDTIEELPVVVPASCAYATNDRPNHDGVISEVAWMGSGDDANAEWVEIQNRTKASLDVSGWQLIDKAEQIRAIVPDGVVLLRNGFLVFERDEHLLPGATVLYKGALSNTDEGLRLFNAECELQDEVIAKSKWPAGTNSPKHTAERDKNLDWHTYYGDGEAGIFGTPGRKNSAGPPPEPEPSAPTESEQAESVIPGAPIPEESTASSSEPGPVVIASGQLIISEVMAGDASGAGNEFIELYNTTDSEIDLTGISIKKKVLSSGSESSLVTTVNFEGKRISAGQRFIIGHGSFTAQTQMTWPTSYSIAYTGNAALLYNAQAQKIDEVSWELSDGQSYACASQGSCIVQEVPTPGN